MQTLILAIALSAPAPAPTPSPMPNFLAPDAAFYRKAAEEEISGIELGTLAEEKSTNPRVKDFGAEVVSDHRAANAKLRSVAESKKIKLPTHASLEQRAAKAKLQGLSGETFDKTYVDGMIKDHEQTIQVFSKESRSGTDPDAKAFATATLPALQAHLEKLKSLAASSAGQTN